MQLFTATQTRQLQLTAIAAYDALVIVEDAFCHTGDRALVALTSDRAIATYKTVWAVTRYTAILTAAAAFYAGVLTRKLWNRFCVWADGYVQSCQQSPDVPSNVPSNVPIALPPARPRRTNTVTVLQEDRILVTPAPQLVDMNTSTQPAKRKRGRPRKVA